jgi:hypothetical protein
MGQHPNSDVVRDINGIGRKREFPSIIIAADEWPTLPGGRRSCKGAQNALLNENGLAPTGFTVLDGTKALGKIQLEQRQGDRQDMVVLENLS